MPRIILLRHGQASFGSPDYDRLSERGLRQVRVAAAELRRQDPGVDVIVSGSLSRQRETAEVVASTFATEYEVSSGWDEYDSDDILTHHSTSPLRQNRPPGPSVAAASSREFQDVLERAVREWIVCGEDTPCRESWPAFRGRVRAALTALGDGLGHGEVGLACTSGGVMAAICVGLLAAEAQAFVLFNRVAVNGGVSRILYGRSGATLLSFNEHAHLLAGDDRGLTFR
ncbi:MAG: histidine phosphatase family protein [Marmoricola sp.]